MRLSLIPRDRAFFDLFDRSAANAVEGAKVYQQMVTTYGDPKVWHKQIFDLEHKGDDITHETIRRLNTTFVTPIDREDIHGLATDLDDIVDFVEAAADMFILHNIEAPTEEARQQADVLVAICEAVAQAVQYLRRFKGLEEHWVTVHQLENDGDRIYRRAIASLFGGNYKAMDVLKWKEIYDQVEQAIDGCERIATRLEAIVLKHA